MSVSEEVTGGIPGLRAGAWKNKGWVGVVGSFEGVQRSSSRRIVTLSLKEIKMKYVRPYCVIAVS